MVIPFVWKHGGVSLNSKMQKKLKFVDIPFTCICNIEAVPFTYRGVSNVTISGYPNIIFYNVVSLSGDGDSISPTLAGFKFIDSTTLQVNIWSVVMQTIRGWVRVLYYDN